MDARKKNIIQIGIIKGIELYKGIRRTIAPPPKVIPDKTKYKRKKKDLMDDY